MSTVLPTEADLPGEPLSGTDALVEYFAQAEKPREKFRIGTEHEKFGFLRDPKTLAVTPLPFEGPRSIEAIFDAIVSQDSGWVRVTDAGRTIALYRDGLSISLEPAGQLELSGAPLCTVHDTARELRHMLSLGSGPRSGAAAIWSCNACRSSASRRRATSASGRPTSASVGHRLQFCHGTRTV